MLRSQKHTRAPWVGEFKLVLVPDRTCVWWIWFRMRWNLWLWHGSIGAVRRACKPMGYVIAAQFRFLNMQLLRAGAPCAPTRQHVFNVWGSSELLSSERNFSPLNFFLLNFSLLKVSHLSSELFSSELFSSEVFLFWTLWVVLWWVGAMVSGCYCEWVLWFRESLVLFLFHNFWGSIS